jgi:hypothetical protein
LGHNDVFSVSRCGVVPPPGRRRPLTGAEQGGCLL